MECSVIEIDLTKMCQHVKMDTNEAFFRRRVQLFGQINK